MYIRGNPLPQDFWSNQKCPQIPWYDSQCEYLGAMRETEYVCAGKYTFKENIIRIPHI